MSKPKSGRPRDTKERVHIVVERELMNRLRCEAERDGQSLSVKIERTIEKGLAA